MVPSQSNVLEAGPGMTRDQEKEWYYEVNNERKGPVSFKEVRNFLWLLQNLSVKFSAERFMCRTNYYCKNKMLGPGYGVVALPPPDCSAQVGFACPRRACAGRKPASSLGPWDPHPTL